MCRGLGMLVFENGDIRFCAPDPVGDISHSHILKGLGIEDSTELFRRPFVRVEFPEWTIESFEWDENGTLPSWAEDPEVKDRVLSLASDLIGIWDKEELKKLTSEHTERENVRHTAYMQYSHQNDIELAEIRSKFNDDWAPFMILANFGTFRKMWNKARSNRTKVKYQEYLDRRAAHLKESEKDEHGVQEKLESVFSTVKGYVFCHYLQESYRNCHIQED